MKKISTQIKFNNRFLLTAFLLFLTGFLAKADVIYASPLQGAEHEIGNLLEWSTAFEKDSHTFIVERSINGIDFLKAGVIGAAGSSNMDRSYRFLDLGINDEQLFYRLKQVDTDGTSSFSPTIIIKKEMANQFMVVAMSNTLTNSTFEITIDAIEKATLEFTLKNKEGELISKNNQLLYRGLNDVQLDLKDEKEGIYFVSLRIDQETEMLVIHKVEDPIKKKPNLVSKPLKKGG